MHEGAAARARAQSCGRVAGLLSCAGLAPLWGRLRSVGFFGNSLPLRWPSRCAIDPAGAGMHEDVRREWSALLAHAATATEELPHAPSKVLDLEAL